MTTNPPRDHATKASQRAAGRDSRRGDNAARRRIIRHAGEIEKHCAEATRTVTSSDTESGYDYKPGKSPQGGRFTFAEAERIVADEMKRLARKTTPVAVPDDYNDPAYSQAIAQRTMQIVAHNREKQQKAAVKDGY